MTIELRSYQKNQLKFIERKMKQGIGVAIKSPTGSGKSIVILEYVNRLLKQNEGKNFTVVISTGFNNLVYQLAEDAKMFDIKPIIWVGAGHLASESKIRAGLGLDDKDPLDIKEHQAFTEDPTMRTKPGESCTAYQCKRHKEFGHYCLFHQARNKMKSMSGPKVIITNHMSYLYGLNYNTFTPDVAIIDESHTFATYYEMYKTMQVAPKDIQYVQEKLDDSDPTLMLFKRSIEKGLNINPNLMKQVVRKIGESGNKKAMSIANNMQELSGVTPSIERYIEVSKDVGIEVTDFWSNFDIKQNSINYLLISATQDSFTLKMFGVPKQNLYVELDCNTIDYAESELWVYQDEEYGVAASKFLSAMREKGAHKGLMLSTTNKDIRYLQSLGEIQGYKVYTNKDEFESADHPSVLAGSRMLFQGVNISGLDFVSLNKIPFPNYNDKFKAMNTYLENIAGMNPWIEFTIPKVVNDLTQSTGRLWRKPGDSGVIAIFDDRLAGKMSYLIKDIKRERAGIKVTIIEDEYTKNKSESESEDE